MSTSSARTSGHINARRRGRIGELLCGYKLASDCCCDVVFVDGHGYDIIAIDPVVGVLRVECKSAHKTVRDKPGSTPVLHFSCATGSKVKKPIDPNVVDVVALVDVPGERVMFRTVESLRRRKTVKMQPSRFDERDLEWKTWNEVVRYFAQTNSGK